MYAQGDTIPTSLTSRVNKIHHSLNNSQQKSFIPIIDELISNHHTHRKYKLSHSQIDKISKQSIHKLRQKKLNSRFLAIQDIVSNTSSQSQIRQQIQKQQIIQTNNASAKFNVQSQTKLQISHKKFLYIELIKFNIPIIVQPNQEHPIFLNLRSRQVQIITFQVYQQQVNVHYRAECIYQSLNSQIKFLFSNVKELYEYLQAEIRMVQKCSQQNKKQIFRFDRNTYELSFKICLNAVSCTNNQVSKSLRTKQKYLKLILTTHPVIQIEEDHHLQNNNAIQQNSQINQLKKKNQQQANELQFANNLINQLKQQNQALKSNLKKQIIQIQIEKAQKQVLIQNLQKISKASQRQKQYFFQFVPDPKAKNYSNFSYKNQIIKKVKNDLKWDQISSQAPLPQAGRHFFIFDIKNYAPDFMLGIVTIKGKDTLNAFLGLETICLYSNKNCFIYQRGKHYKLNNTIKNDDKIYVIIDKQKGVIEWKKKKSTDHNKKQGQQNKSKDQNLCSTLSPHAQNDGQNIVCSTTSTRRGSQKFELQIPSNKSCLNCLIRDNEEQIQYIHSVKIPQQILNRQIYAYAQIYNINEPLMLNEKR